MSGPLTEMRTMHWTYFLASSVTTVSPVACMRPGNAHWAGCGLAAYGEMVYGEVIMSGIDLDVNCHFLY